MLSLCILVLFIVSNGRRLIGRKRESQLSSASNVGCKEDSYLGITIPHASMTESHRYTFAMILRQTAKVKAHLKSTRGRISETLQYNLETEVRNAHRKVLRRLVNAGLGVVVLKNTYEVCHHSAVLERPCNLLSLSFFFFLNMYDILELIFVSIMILSPSFAFHSETSSS